MSASSQLSAALLPAALSSVGISSSSKKRTPPLSSQQVHQAENSDLDFWFTASFFCKQIKWKLDEVISFFFFRWSQWGRTKRCKSAASIWTNSAKKKVLHIQGFEPRIPKCALHHFFSFFVCPQRFRSQDVDKVLYHRAQDKQPWGVKRKTRGDFKKNKPEWGEDAVTTSPLLGQQKSYSSIQRLMFASTRPWKRMRNCLQSRIAVNAQKRLGVGLGAGMTSRVRNARGIVHLLFIQNRSGLTKTIGWVCRETCLNTGGSLLPQMNDPVDLTDVLTFPLEATRWFSSADMELPLSISTTGRSEFTLWSENIPTSTRWLDTKNLAQKFLPSFSTQTHPGWLMAAPHEPTWGCDFRRVFLTSKGWIAVIFRTDFSWFPPHKFIKALP